MKKIDIKSLTLTELTDFLASISEPRYRAVQIFKWLSTGVSSFSEMTNISKATCEKLSSLAFINNISISKKNVSSMDGTVKYLFKLSDGECIETVVMSQSYGYSICISSQVGCRMGCDFCASTKAGFVRNLTPSEMLDQILFSSADLNIKIAKVVIMGIGEPLDNFDNVISFLKIISSKEGFNFSLRNLSLSTCGIVPMINKLADFGFGLTLSISLHAPDNITRDKIMPINNAYNIQQLIIACDNYFKKTGRRISYEYTLIDGVNDSLEMATALAKLLKGKNCHINLIPVNTIREKNYKKSLPSNVNNFLEILSNKGLNATIRKSRGQDINASCGQLRNDNF